MKKQTEIAFHVLLACLHAAGMYAACTRGLPDASQRSLAGVRFLHLVNQHSYKHEPNIRARHRACSRMVTDTNQTISITSSI